MGVPVVTLVGQTAVSRAGWSQLSNLGLTDLAAHDAGRFVQVAAGLAANPGRLTELRSTLRQRMKASPLMDAPASPGNRGGIPHDVAGLVPNGSIGRESPSHFRQFVRPVWCGAAPKAEGRMLNMPAKSRIRSRVSLRSVSRRRLENVTTRHREIRKGRAGRNHQRLAHERLRETARPISIENGHLPR